MEGKVVTSCEEGCTTLMSRGCLLLPPVVATIRSGISEPRKVCISSRAPSCERSSKEEGSEIKETEERDGGGFPRCCWKYRKVTQACNSLNNL